MSQQAPGTWQALVLILATAALALAIRLYLLSNKSVDSAIEPDSVGYIELAQGLRAGCGFARLSKNVCQPAEIMRTPGYPLFLAFAGGVRRALVLQTIAGAVTALLLGIFAWREWRVTAGFLAEVLVGFDAPSIRLGTTILSETLFTLIITLAVLLQMRSVRKGASTTTASRQMLAAGFLIGLAALTRPIAQVLIPLLALPALAIGTSGRLRLTLAAFTVSAALVLTGVWTVRNYTRRGLLRLSTIAAINMYYYRAAGVIAYETGNGFENVKDDFLRSGGGWDADPVEIQSRGIRIIVRHPWAAAAVASRRFLHKRFSILLPVGFPSLHGAPSGTTFPRIATKIRSIAHSPLWVLVVGTQLFLAGVTWIGVLLAVRKLACLRISDAAAVMIPLATALILLAAAAGPESYFRFRVPAVPMLALVATFGWKGLCIAPGRTQLPDIPA